MAIKSQEKTIINFKIKGKSKYTVQKETNKTGDTPRKIEKSSFYYI